MRHLLGMVAAYTVLRGAGSLWLGDDGPASTDGPTLLRVGPTPTPGDPFDDTVTPYMITWMELHHGDVVDGVRAHHRDGTTDPLRGQHAGYIIVKFTPDDPLIGLSGERGRYFGKDAVIRLTVHSRSGYTYSVGEGVADAGTVTPFDLRAPDPANQRVTGLFGSTESHTSGENYLAGLGFAVATDP